jgi:hypothetical protein
MSIREERWGLGMVSSGQNGRTVSGSCLQHTSWHIERSFQINVTFLPCPWSGVIFFLSQYGWETRIVLAAETLLLQSSPLAALMHRRRVGPSVLPCFEVPRLKGCSLSDGHRKPERARVPTHLWHKHLP